MGDPAHRRIRCANCTEREGAAASPPSHATPSAAGLLIDCEGQQWPAQAVLVETVAQGATSKEVMSTLPYGIHNLDLFGSVNLAGVSTRRSTAGSMEVAAPSPLMHARVAFGTQRD